jgi:3-hydroxyacyl-CoA dehydrogenase
MIGRAWAVCFARAGMSVAIWSRNDQSSIAAKRFVKESLALLETEGLLGECAAADIPDRIEIHRSLDSAVKDAEYVQENLPEDLATKRAIFTELDDLCGPDTIIASSASALLASEFTKSLAGRDRCLVVHPVNPPYLIPATEIVPAPWTAKSVVEKACRILSQAGQVPVVLAKEIDGFVVNRLQAALLNEAFRLVGEGYAEVADIDTAIKHGLALRWSFMGPFETIDLNAPEGVRDYVGRYFELYRNLLSQMEHMAEWRGEVLNQIEAARRKILPVDELATRQAWRDRRLMALAAHKVEINKRIGR